jgi:hypothetical protein
MNVNAVSDAQMTLLAKSLQAAREQATAITSPENAVMQAVAAQTNLAVAAQASGLVNTYA